MSKIKNKNKNCKNVRKSDTLHCFYINPNNFTELHALLITMIILIIIYLLKRMIVTQHLLKFAPVGLIS